MINSISTIILVFLLVAICIIFFIISIYNSLIKGRNEYKNAFKQIDIQFNRRYDLIPNLVECAKEYMSHEHKTLEDVISARNQAKSALDAIKNNAEHNDAIKSLSTAESILKNSMNAFLAVAENYPELKADKTISKLMEEITSTENRIAFAQQSFNDLVTDFNNSAQIFPNNIIASIFNFQAAGLLQISDIEHKRERLELKF